jgi:hypothetical protein
MGLVLNLDRDEWFVALLFGVLIDMDHLFAAPRYISDNGLAAILRPTWDDGSGHAWKSLFHYPVSFFVVAPLSIGWRYMIPLLFWSVHLGMDYLQTEFVKYSTPMEAVVFTGACTGILFIQYRAWSESRSGSDFRGYAAYVYHRVRSIL